MVRRITLALLALSVSAFGAIDFAPTPLEIELEGIRSSQPSFRDDAAVVTFSPPQGWSVEGSGAVLQLRPKDVAMALARVETYPLKALVLESPDSVKLACGHVAALLPPQAQGLAWAPEIERNPVVFNRHETFRLEGTYDVLGQKFRATVVVCHLANQRLEFFLTARERDFPKLYETWRRSFFTWQGLK